MLHPLCGTLSDTTASRSLDLVHDVFANPIGLFRSFQRQAYGNQSKEGMSLTAVIFLVLSS